MIDSFKQIVASQYEAALCMLRQCIECCPGEHWESPIAKAPFRWVAYHTLFYTDLYLSPSNKAFELRELHARGGDEREPKLCPGLPQAEALEYATFCRQKALAAVPRETSETLAGPSGFSWYPVTRGEMHLVNLRHIQHHTGQLSAFLRKLDSDDRFTPALRWVRSGWREPASG
jgi:hypothetical protein